MLNLHVPIVLITDNLNSWNPQGRTGVAVAVAFKTDYKTKKQLVRWRTASVGCYCRINLHARMKSLMKMSGLSIPLYF